MPVKNLPGFSIPDNLIYIEGYKLIRAGHPDNIKTGGVYYKESLAVQIINQHYLKEALLLEMSYNNKKAIVSVIYCSSSQGTDEFDSFISNFNIFLNEINKLKPSLSVVTGDLIQDLPIGGVKTSVLFKD